MADTAQKLPNIQKFIGFSVPEQNWFRMPNEWTNITAEINSLAELKVVEYVLRHTWGYQEYGLKKHITLDEFMFGRKKGDNSRMDKGTGLSKPSVIMGLKLAVDRGLLIEEIDATDKARVKKSYCLRMKTPEQGSDKRGVKNLNADVKNLYPGSQESILRSEKDTLERNQKKEKQQTASEKKNFNNNSSEANLNSDVVVALIEKGISKGVAQRLASHYKREQILEKIEFLAFLQETKPKQVKDAAAWLRRAIEDDFTKPAGYVYVSHEEREAAEKARQQAEEEQQRRYDAQIALEEANHERRRKIREKQLSPLKRRYKTSEPEEKIWFETLSHLQAMSPAAVKLFLSDSMLLSLGDSTAVIWLSSSYARQQIEREFGLALKRLLAKRLKVPYQEVSLTFLVSEQSDDKEEHSTDNSR